MKRPAAQLYTVRDAIAADRPAALARLAALGFRDVELYGFVDDAEGYRRDLAAAGLTAVSGHASLVDAPVERALEAAAVLGLRYLVEPAVPTGRWQSADSVAATANALAEAAALAPGDLTIGYHNHAWELASRLDGSPALAVLVERLDALGAPVVLEVDAYWVEAGGVEVVPFLRDLGARAALIHVKDGDGTADVRDQVAAGSGTLDVDGVLAATPHAVHILELDAFRGDPFDALRDGLAYLETRA